MPIGLGTAWMKAKVGTIWGGVCAFTVGTPMNTAHIEQIRIAAIKVANSLLVFSNSLVSLSLTAWIPSVYNICLQKTKNFSNQKFGHTFSTVGERECSKLDWRSLENAIRHRLSENVCFPGWTKSPFSRLRQTYTRVPAIWARLLSFLSPFLKVKNRGWWSVRGRSSQLSF